MPSGTGRRLTDQQRLAWLRLIRSENVGPRAFRNLLNHAGGAQAALDALPDLARRGGALISPRICTERDAVREIEAVAAAGGRMVALGEPDYPPTLAATDGAPPLVTVRGDASALIRPMVAIVGARNASAAGRAFAQRLASDLGRAGLVVVSGLARGIDTAAHEASLETGTVAVLAGGLDRIYPPENVPLLRRIEERGSGITEMPFGFVPRAREFPRRNRIIAALSLGTVIVEAAMRSGSLITARLAAELGRDVMAAPGSPLDPRCEGSNGLLRDGATLVTRADHVLEALGTSLENPPASPLLVEEEASESWSATADDSLRARIEELLGPSPAPVDDIVRMSGGSARAVQLVLLEIELAGRLERHAGGRVSRVF